MAAGLLAKAHVVAASVALVVSSACNDGRAEAEPVTVGALQEICRVTNAPVTVFEASEEELTSPPFELHGPFEIGFGGRGGVPVRIEVTSTEGTVAWSSASSAVGVGVHCVGTPHGEGTYTLRVTPQPSATSKTTSFELLLVVFAL